MLTLQVLLGDSENFPAAEKLPPMDLDLRSLCCACTELFYFSCLWVK